MPTHECRTCKKVFPADSFYNGECYQCYIKKLELENKALLAFAKYMKECIVETCNDGFVLVNTCAELIKIKVQAALAAVKEN